MVGRLVQIDDEYGGGIYRVFAVVSKGDTKEGDWHMSVSGISQVGDSPDITAATMNVWR
jgi:hypothetical protein